MHELILNQHIVNMLPPVAAPAGLEQPVSLKLWDHATIIVQIDNATSVTGATITLKQGTAVGAVGTMTDEKALEFDWVYKSENTAAADALTRTAVTSDTFDSITTNNLNLLYVMEVEAASLDVANSFDCLRVDLTGNANCVVSAAVILSRGTKLGGSPKVSAITD